MTTESRGVCSGIKFTRSKDGICKVFLDYGNARVEVISTDRSRDYVSGYRINTLIREALGKDPLPPMRPIVIEIRGGVVPAVLDVPQGIEYEVRDYDNEARERMA